MRFPTHPGCTHNGMGTHWPAVLCIEVDAYMVCIWSLQTCYMHAHIKYAYKRVNLSRNVLSHASWTHAHGMGTHWLAVLCIEVGAHMVCIWSLQTCYVHACIKSAYMRVNLSGPALSYASWTHAYWHGHTMACSVVYRVMHTCVHQPLCIWSL